MAKFAPRRPVCVIGAGVSGLLTARRLLETGAEVRVIERRADLGGLWNPDARYGGAYRSAHLISSKHTTELPDFPMPAGFPDFPGRADVLSYLRALADRHALREHLTFGREVTGAAPAADGGWRVELDDGTADEYAGLVIATGHHWAPAPPPVSDAGFDGTVVQATAYQTPEALAGRRVIVAGLGNTACDIAVDAVYAGAQVTLSVRGGNHVVPKYLFGQPTDRLGKDVALMRLTHRLPSSVRSVLDERTMRTLGGRPERFGLPRPRHRLYDRQPLVNSMLLYHLGHGDIRVRPPITELRSSGAVFADGTEDKADVIVWANGYRASFPFCDVAAHLNGDDRGRPRLALNMFHPGRRDVVAVGLVDPLGSWPALDLQARLAARHLSAVLAGTGSLHAAGPLDVPAPGAGPDREWLFRGHDYTRELEAALARLDGSVSD
jgi:cation diffusion facilitator CzcD-associated flavoprotein CzcO